VYFVTGRMDDCASPACLWWQYSLGGKGQGLGDAGSSWGYWASRWVAGMLLRLLEGLIN